MKLKPLILPHCWVCGARFVTSVPPGPALEERHHLFPRNAGGTDGPVVSLCDTHHTKAHKVAKAIQGKRDFSNILLGETAESAKKIIWIASLIVRAEALTAGDPNKAKKVVLPIAVNEERQLEYLKQRFNLNSSAAVYQLALSRLFNSS